jgi:hypothetical protein
VALKLPVFGRLTFKVVLKRYWIVGFFALSKSLALMEAASFCGGASKRYSGQQETAPDKK